VRNVGYQQITGARLRLISIFLVGLLCVSTRAQPVIDPHVLSSLKFQTGWIMLGMRDVLVGEWATVLQYEVKSETNAPRGIYLSRAGDVLEVTADHRVYILDFATRGEALRFYSPAGRTDHPTNFTGVTLRPGTLVKIEDTHGGPIGGSLQLIWARVSPEASR